MRVYREEVKKDTINSLLKLKNGNSKVSESKKLIDLKVKHF